MRKEEEAWKELGRALMVTMAKKKFPGPEELDAWEKLNDAVVHLDVRMSSELCGHVMRCLSWLHRHVLSLISLPVLLVILCSLPFYLSVTYSEWYIDELFAITRNEDARGETPIARVLVHDFWGNHLWADGSWTHKSYRPLVTLSYWLQFHFNGYFFKPQPLRVFSCLLNTATGVLLYFVIWKVFKTKKIHSAFGGAVFVAHSVHVENVVYLVGRADVMAAFFWLLGVACYSHFLKLQGKELLCGSAFDGQEAIRRASDESDDDGDKDKVGGHEMTVAEARGEAGTEVANLKVIACSEKWVLVFWWIFFGAASGFSKEPGFTVFAIYFFMEICSHTRAKVGTNMISKQDHSPSHVHANDGSLVSLDSSPTVAHSNRILIRPSITNLLMVISSFIVIYGFRSYLVGGTHVEFSYVDTPIPYQKPKLTRTLSYMHLHAEYMRLLILPWHQSWDYSYDAVPVVNGFTDIRLIEICVAYLLIATVVFIGCMRFIRKADCRILMGVALVIIPFLPASNIFFTVGTVIGERLLYISTIGLGLLAAVGLEGVSIEERKIQSTLEATAVHRNRSMSTLSGVKLIRFGLYCWLSMLVYNCINRTRLWRSRVTLFGEDAKHFRRSAKTLHQFATTLHRSNHLKEARQLYEASLAVFDDNALTDYCVAQIHVESKEYEYAYSRFQKIVNGHGIGFGNFNRFLLLIDFGFTCVAMQRYQEAVPLLKEGLGLNLDVPHGLNALAYAYVQLGQLQEAVNTLETGLRYDPGNYWIWNNLSNVLLMGGNINEAATFSERALELAILFVNENLANKDTETGQLNTVSYRRSYENANAIPSAVLATARKVLKAAKQKTFHQPQLHLFFNRML